MSQDLELFKPEQVQSKSPLLAFIEKHGIKTKYGQMPSDDGKSTVRLWMASNGKYFAASDTEIDAIYTLASKYNLEGWQTINWG